MKAKLITHLPQPINFSGDPKQWGDGVYQNIKFSTSFVFVSGGCSLFLRRGGTMETNPRGLYDGYTRLPDGSKIEITV